MDAREVTDHLQKHFHTHEYKLENSFIFHDWECDFFCQTPAQYFVEAEVKISRGDFFVDFKKGKHKFFEQAFNKKTYFIENRGKMNGDFICRYKYGELVSRYDYRNQKEVYDISHNIKDVYAPATQIKITPFDKLDIPNQFYYVVPNGLIKESEVPLYAGLMYCSDNGIDVIRKAPYLHKRKMDLRIILLSKYYNLFKYKFKALQNENAFLKRELYKEPVK